MAAPTSISMGKSKRKLGDLSVDEFMQGGFETSSSSASESDRVAKKVKKNADKETEGKGKKSKKKQNKTKNGGSKLDTGVAAAVGSGKSSMDKLQEQDPDFYEFLRKEDASLLKFGDMSASESEDEVSDGSTDMDDNSEEDDLEIPESSDEETGTIKPKKGTKADKAKTKKETIKEGKVKKSQEAKASSKQEKKSKKKQQPEEDEDEEDDDDNEEFNMDFSDSDDEGMFHKLPQNLEEMSNSDSDEPRDLDEDSEDDEEEAPEGGVKRKSKGGRTYVTMTMIEDWSKRLKELPSPAVLHEAALAFRAAVQRTASKNLATKYIVEESKVFNAIVRMCLVEIPPALHTYLGIAMTTDLQKPVLPSKDDKKWKKVSEDVKCYLTDVLQLLSDLSEASMINVLLKHVHKLIAFYASFPRLTKVLLKRVTSTWCTGEETSRVLAFLCINRVVRIKQSSLLEGCIKHMYMAYVKNCKFTSPSSLPLINFMQRSLVEILAIDFRLAYQYAFVYIRQLAIHLRNALTMKKKESCQAVYNWQYIHCLGLWARVLSLTHPNDVMEPLIYPLVQTIIGTVKLIPTPKYYPLRFHCVRALTMISRATNTFIPVLPFLLEANIFQFEVIPSNPLERFPEIAGLL